MIWKADTLHQRFVETETGTIKKDWTGRIKVALIYPNRYAVGMSNLGFQAVYHLLNRIDHVVCERAFLPEKNTSATRRVTTIETGSFISDFDIVAFSFSFENDYPNLLTILDRERLPLWSSDRGTPHPLLIAGGVACFLNPEPIAPFIDCFLIGEAEAILPRFFDTSLFDLLEMDRASCLETLAQNIPGTYVPAFYRPEYTRDGTLLAFEPTADVPTTIKRVFVNNLSESPCCSTVLTPETSFERTFLIEVGRGCPHGCRFCASGYIYRPPRFRSLSLLSECLQRGASLTDRIGLVGAAVSDLPGITRLCERVDPDNVRLSFSSLRADALSNELIAVLKKNRVKTATIAPDAGSERLRNVINKGLTETDILKAAENLVSAGIPNLKLYFMLGLPTEMPEDVDAIVELCKKVKHNFLKSSRTRKRIGEISVSISSFVPKPFTPFQWVAMEDMQTLKKKIKKVKSGLKRVSNVTVHADVPRWAYIQALFSRGDRKVAQVLSLAHDNQGNWPKTFKASPANTDFYVYRKRALEELLPWDFIDHGIEKSFLAKEYRRALQNKTSPPCPMKSCNLCGVCETENDKTGIERDVRPKI
ncbi:MAG: TIGR03960 family B12-binding radical SAM protein [Deltaproteobacteria bacterium]|nr:TIGR03960 family B12-binding radical SAM protein [Deltaproteobacteria bacterium]